MKKTILIYPTYFPSIAQMVAVAKADKVILEVHDNYQKQTYRNRVHIAHANGKLLLNVPIKHSKDGTRQRTKDVLIENDFPWQLHHWKSLQSAYRTSPFFEFYEDDLHPLFTKKANGLMNHNLEIFNVLIELIGFDIEVEMSKSYAKEPEEIDLRNLCVSKKEKNYNLQAYTQVLEANHGFLPNLSVLDLLFNEGPNCLNYLEGQDLKFN